MNDTQVTKRKIGALIAKNLIVMLVAVIVALTGVLAWFSNTTSAEANGINVECKAPDGVYIAIVEHNAAPPAPGDYKTTLTLNKENYKFLEKLEMTEVTGDGINGKLLRPALTQSGGMAHVDTSVDWGVASENKDFLSFDLYIRSESEHTICLSSSSSITPVSSQLEWKDGEASEANNPSTYGNFSKDCIVGAVRFSVVFGADTRQLLWIPAPNIRLKDTADSVTTNLTNGETYVHNYYKPNHESDSLSGADIVAKKYDVDSPYTLGKNVDIVKLSKQDTQGTDRYYYNHVTCNMWIEGEDHEARLALVGGDYKVNLELVLKDDTKN